MALTIAFRADASIQIGTGHVMRCLTLAEELSRKGHECLFICREHEGHLGELIAQKGFALHLLPAIKKESDESTLLDWNAHAQWLGVHWQCDAEQSLNAIAQQQLDWLIVDHYALDARWERQLAVQTKHMMVIDDLADRPHECDLLLDQNVLSEDSKAQYKAQVNSDCKLLLGPKYALLRPEYAALAKALPERDGTISRVLIFVGGSDPYHLTEHYLKVLDEDEFTHLFVDVVIGKNHPSPATVGELVAQRSNTRLYSGLPSLAALMVRADLMLGAGGATNWERMCLGLNSVVVSVADNQDTINEQLASKKLINFLGGANNLVISEVRGAITLMLTSREYIQHQSSVMKNIVDGCGTQYIVQNMKEICSRVSS